jgi:phenylalanyl-tRNA synthetase beta chain
VARELSAISDSKLKIADFDSRLKTQDSRLVTIEDSEICHRFTARIIKNVKISPSPQWLVDRLEAIGQRSINNVADITNYVMHELGNPMHAFDFNKLAENRIIVRRAKAGESIKTLDEVERKLDESMLMICDAEKPIAVGGVMGGFDSSISNETTEVLLEVAYFKRESIRQTSRDLKLSTEASHHFERGVDIENLIRASNRATELIIELAGGIAEDLVDVYPTKFVQNEIEVEDISHEVEKLTGLEILEGNASDLLNKLGFKSAFPINKSIIFTVPTWRHDISIKQDLVEEIARHIGYDKIGSELPPSQSAGEYQPTELRKKSLRRAMADLGFDEAISYSFIRADFDDKFQIINGLIDENADEKFITLQDSIIEGAERMRPSLLSGLLDAVRTNFNYQHKNVRLFELGKVFAHAIGENSLPKEQELFSFVVTGSETFDKKAITGKELDFFDAKAALETAIDSINLPSLEYVAKDVKHLRKGQSAEVFLDGKSVGTIGRINDEIAQGYKFKQPVFVAEIDLQTLFEAKQNAVFYKPLPKFPAVSRDISLLVKRSTTFAEILQTIQNEGFELCKSVEFIDVYEGKGVADDERSITIRLIYRSDERTLIEAEVEEIHSKILSALESKLNAKPRF